MSEGPGAGGQQNPEGQATRTFPSRGPHPATIAAFQEWYYEIDGRAHGPLAWSDLQDLLGHSGETADDVRIRKGAKGEWTAFRARPSTAGTPELAQPELAPTAPAPESPQRSDPPYGRTALPNITESRFAAFFRRYRDILAIVAVWIVLNALFFLWPEPYAWERQYLATLQRVVAEADQLRAKGASDEQWQEIARRTRGTLEPMVWDLQESASSSKLPRQQLLWCARDLVPKIMGPHNKERDQEVRRLKEYLESVEKTVAPH